MNALVWDESLAIGDETVDNQHKTLFEAVNSLVRAIASSDSKDSIAKILVLLEKYADVHFAAEEKLMKSINYRDLEKHKAIHDDFRVKVQELKSKFDKGEVHIKFETFAFVKDWLLNHVSGDDQDIGRWLLRLRA